MRDMQAPCILISKRLNVQSVADAVAMWLFLFIQVLHTCGLTCFVSCTSNPSCEVRLVLLCDTICFSLCFSKFFIHTEEEQSIEMCRGLLDGSLCEEFINVCFPSGAGYAQSSHAAGTVNYTNQWFVLFVIPWFRNRLLVWNLLLYHWMASQC